MGIVEKDKKCCLNCNYPIYKRRLGAIYFTVKCGYTFRNSKDRLDNKNQNKIVKIIRKNDLILHKMFSNTIFRISYTHIKHLGYNFEYYSKAIIENNQLVGAELFKYKIKKIDTNHFKIEQL